VTNSFFETREWEAKAPQQNVLSLTQTKLFIDLRKKENKKICTTRDEQGTKAET
jgi:hypothetical protein